MVYDDGSVGIFCFDNYNNPCLTHNTLFNKRKHEMKW